MGKRTKIITEYRQTGGDADADAENIVGMGTEYFTVSSSSFCALGIQQTFVSSREVLRSV